MRSQSKQWQAFVMVCMAVSLLLHLIAAVFSVGYHSADEHFQILEFLSYKLGNTPVHHLPVEFGEKMRPWLQPWLYWLLTQVGNTIFGIENPFSMAFIFRAFTGLVGWLSVVTLAMASGEWFKENEAIKRTVIYLLTFLWFFPVLHVRPSSESLSGSMFILSLVLALYSYGFLSAREWSEWRWCKNRKAINFETSAFRLLSGFGLGLSFEFRFQMGLMICGAILWFLFQKKFRVWHYWPTLCGLLLSLLLGRIVDYWGYGTLSFSPYNYLSYNLLRGEVSRYGTAPWWDIFRMSFTESWPVLGTFLTIACILAWIFNPRHVLTWCHLPFFLVHETIAHKELRFFFPIASASPVLMGLCLIGFRASLRNGASLRNAIFGLRLCQAKSKKILTAYPTAYPTAYLRMLRSFGFFLPSLGSNLARLVNAPLLRRALRHTFGALFFRKKISIWGLWFLGINNFIALVFLILLPASRTVQFYEGLNQEMQKNQTTEFPFEVIFFDKDPFEILGNPIFYYRPKNLKLTHFGTSDNFREKIRQTSHPIWLFSNKLIFPTEAAMLQSFCKITFQTLPKWITELLKSKPQRSLNFFSWTERTNFWSLWRCESFRNYSKTGP